MAAKSTTRYFGTLAVLLAVAAVLTEPRAIYAATDSAGTTITATIAATISLTTSTNVGISLTPTAGGVVSSASDTVTVNSNSSTGYTLSLADADATTNLVSGGNTIAAHTGTFAAPTTLANNTWGYRIVSAGGFGGTAYSAETNNASSSSTWAGVPASGSPVTIKTTASTATNDVTTVWYGVKVTTAKPSGAYVDTVTYTATTN